MPAAAGDNPDRPAVTPDASAINSLTGTALDTTPAATTAMAMPVVEKPAGDPWQKFIAQSLEAKYTESELRAGGVVAGMPLPSDLRFGLVDLQNGIEPTEYWLGTENFFAITQYNRSFFYAMSVVDLGRAVRIARSRL
ncbi:MAG: lytic murein transglycosylase [Herminiimonas sp.]|nr:lytic murein transglycosylase [Herminiimonas sp.]